MPEDTSKIKDLHDWPPGVEHLATLIGSFPSSDMLKARNGGSDAAACEPKESLLESDNSKLATPEELAQCLRTTSLPQLKLIEKSAWLGNRIMVAAIICIF